MKSRTINRKERVRITLMAGIQRRELALVQAAEALGLS